MSSDERDSVERHLSGCAACRELLARARDQHELGAARGPEELAAHVHPRLLVQYADEPAALEGETRAWIESKLRECVTCREALDRLREVDARLAATEDRVPAPAGLRTVAETVWAALASTLLRPAPALVYLLALAVLLPALWYGQRSVGDPAVVPRLLIAHGEQAVRGAPGTGEPLAVPASERAVLLELRTRLVADDLEDPAASFRVELRRDGTPLWSRTAGRDEFEVDQGRVVLRVLLEPGRLERGALHEIAITIHKPGDPVDGQALFRQSLRVIRDPGGSRR